MNSKNIAVILSFLVVASGVALAALPDGAEGPWADSAVAYLQGSPVPPERSDPTQALGAAESSGQQADPSGDANGQFFSLGFGGWIILGFDNFIINGDEDDIQIFEVTWGSYPIESVTIEATQDSECSADSDWTTIATDVVRDAEVDLGPLAWATCLRITDTSSPYFPSGNGDGYDLDGVKALHSSPIPPQQEPEGCTLTQGYWKNHEENWPDVDGQPEWFSHDTLETAPAKGNAWYILAHQYIAARLNEASGASVPSEVAEALEAAEELLNDNYPDGIGKGHENRADAIMYAGILGEYNEGLAGVPHCDE